MGMRSYLRKLVRGYNSLVAPIRNIFGDKRFASERARTLLVPWPTLQDKALMGLVEILTAPPTLAVPN